MPQPKVSVIVPVYRVEKYIEKCARSLFEQTLDEIEYIFIDDCSPDKSIDILKEILENFPNRKNQVTIIRHKENKGVSQSRQDGVDAAHGEYIIHCDSDDWVELNMYEEMYQKAIDTNADIVMCDFYEEKHEIQSVSNQNFTSNKISLLKNICDSKFHTSLCNKLIRKAYILQIRSNFNTKVSLWEDMAYLVPLLVAPGRFVKLDLVLYHYRVVSTSLTHQISKTEIKSMLEATKEISANLRAIINGNDYRVIALLLQMKVKDFYLHQDNNYSPNLWRSTFSVVTHKILFLPIPIKRKLLYILCNLHIDFLVDVLVKMRK